MRAILIEPPTSQYGTMFHYTKKMGEALERCEISVETIPGQWLQTPQKIIDHLAQKPPSFTLSFNGLLPDASGNFLSDVLEIPHIAVLIDSPARFTPLFQSKYTFIACADRLLCDFVTNAGFPRVFFCPAAVERDIVYNKKSEWKYDLIMLASCLDYEAIYDQWKRSYPRNIIEALIHAAEITLSERETSYIQSFLRVVNEYAIDPQHLHFERILNELEDYIRGKERVDLINSIKETKVHLWGKSLGEKGWEYYLKNPNVILHPFIPFSEALKVIAESKMLLSSSPTFKAGTHTRVFAASGSGTIPITNDNSFLRETYTQEKDIILFQYGQWDDLNHSIHSLLDHPTKLLAAAQEGRKITLKHHTWDHRASTLVQYLTGCTNFS